MALGCGHCIFLSNLFRSCFVAVEFFTLAAGPVLDVSGFSARSILCFRLGQVMSFSCNYCFFLVDLLRSFAVLEQFSARSAGPVLNVSGFCAGCGLCFRRCQVMRVRQFIDRTLFLVARVILTGPGLKAFLVLCRVLVYDPVAPVVAFRGYYCICFRDLSLPFSIAKDLVAFTAGPVLGVSSLCACCIFRFGLLKGMAFRGYYCCVCCDLGCSLVIAEQFFALAAGPILGITGFGARCGLCVRLFEGMAFRGYYCCVCCDLGCSLVIAEQLFAFAAGPVLGVSGLCAGSSFRFGLLKGMTFCGYYCIFYCDFCCSFVIAEQLFAFAVQVASFASVFSRE